MWKIIDNKNRTSEEEIGIDIILFIMYIIKNKVYADIFVRVGIMNVNLFPRAMSQAAALARIFGECREGKCPAGANTPPLGAERTSQTMSRSLLRGI